MKHPFIALFLGFLFALTISGFVCASEASSTHGDDTQNAEHAEGGHEETWFQIISKWVNFFILAGLLYLFFTRSLRIQDRFKSEYEKIQSSIESARMAKEEAEQKLKELDQKMSQLSEDIVRIKSEAGRAAEEEKKKILESAQKEAERIVEHAHREIDSEVEIARKELRKQLADEAVNRGREIIEREINDEDSKRLMNDYIEGFRK